MTLRPKMRKVKKWPFWGDLWTFGLSDLWKFIKNGLKIKFSYSLRKISIEVDIET